MSDRSYNIRIALTMAVYVALVFIDVLVIRTHAVPSNVRIPIALVPVIPLCYVLVIMVRRIRGLDELQRMIELEAVAIACGVTAIITVTYGILQAFANAPDISYIYVWPLLAIAYAVGVAIGRHRYK